jgi:hypothetical protein
MNNANIIAQLESNIYDYLSNAITAEQLLKGTGIDYEDVKNILARIDREHEAGEDVDEEYVAEELAFYAK